MVRKDSQALNGRCRIRTRTGRLIFYVPRLIRFLHAISHGLWYDASIMKRGLDHSQVVFRIATLLILCFNNRCVAAAAGPALTFDALRSGFGIIAVTGIRAAPREERAYQVRFRVHLVAAQPAVNTPLPLNPGDEMALVLTVGRVGTLSHFGPSEPPVEGAQYYLTVAFNPATRTYSTAIGALSLRQVTEFTEDDLLMFRRIGKLAVAPVTERSTLAIQMLEDPASNIETKINCL